MTETAVRQPAVADRFYPGHPAALRKTVVDLLDAARPANAKPAKALIVPHAGYVYSGPIAASAYRLLQPQRGKIRRVVLLGPSHYVYLRGIALPEASAFVTPLGTIEIDREAIAAISGLPGVVPMAAAHEQEHSLEVHLPFLQTMLDDFTLVPLVVGDVRPEAVSAVLESLWGGEETLIVISSDLSHYHDYATATKLDRHTSHAIETLAYTEIRPENACGCMPLNGMLYLARQKGLSIETIDLRNSGDTAGPRDRVVGYGAYAVRESAPSSELGSAEKQSLLEIARKSIRHGLFQGGPLSLGDAASHTTLNAVRASFVTLDIEGTLRGCIGSLEAHRALATDVSMNAWAAAFRDPRFPALREHEYPQLDIHISVLSTPAPMDFASESQLLRQLRPGIDGLIIQLDDRRATFLPSVWEMLPQPEGFLSQLKQKAGIGADADLSRLQAWRYRTESFGET
jgi:hypothetical protein